MNDNNNSSSSGNLDNASQIMDSSHSLKELARAISLSPERIFEICMSQQQLRNKLKEFNDTAVLKIQAQSYNQALVYLEEAEKLLEAAVNRGNKKIDRVYIICTLQNEACAYQKLWELQKSAEYMEAIIHNMESEIKNGATELQEIYFAEDVVDDKEGIKKCINKLTLMGLYYLQYLAVTSQIKDHETAYNTSEMALKNFKMACQKCYKLQTLESETNQQSVIIHNNMMGELASLPEEVEIDKIPQQIKQTKKVLAKLRQAVSRKKSINDKAIISFKDFAIGQVMQISPITLNELIAKINSKEQVTNLSRLYKALYISICYFSMATQKRLMCTEVSRKFQNNRRTTNTEKQITEVLKISQVYHLRSIYIVSKYIPCENKYLEHIIKSLKNHYEIDLLDVSASDLIEQVSSIDLQSQNLVAEHAQNIHPNLNTNRIKSEKFDRKQKITKLLQSEQSQKRISKKKKTEEVEQITEEVHFGNTIIKKEIENHYKKKMIKSEKNIKTIFSESKPIRHQKEGSKSNSKSHKKIGKNSKNSKVEKKESITVYTEKKTNPTSIRSIDHGPTRLIGSKRPNDRNTEQFHQYPTQKVFKASNRPAPHPDPIQVDSHTSPLLKKSQQKGEKSKIKKRKKPINPKEYTSNSKQKSKSKSRSKSSKRITNTSKQDKNLKNIQKIKKKQNRLQQQYFTKPQHKRKSTKTRHEHKSILKKNSIKMEQNQSPGRNTVTSGHRNGNWKNSMKNY